MQHLAARFHGKIISIPLGLLVALTLLGGTVGLAFAQSTPSWQSQGANQRKCFGTQITPQNDFYISLKGTWTTPITVTITHLPPLAVYGGLYGGAHIPPGSSDGTHVLAYALIKIHRPTPYGGYTVTLTISANDETTLETVSGPFSVVPRCLSSFRGE